MMGGNTGLGDLSSALSNEEVFRERCEGLCVDFFQKNCGSDGRLSTLCRLNSANCWDRVKAAKSSLFSERRVQNLSLERLADSSNSCCVSVCNAAVTSTVLEATTASTMASFGAGIFMPTVYAALAGVSVVSVAAYLGYKLVKQRNSNSGVKKEPPVIVYFSEYRRP